MPAWGSGSVGHTLQGLARWIFGLTVYGTLAIPIVLAVVAWRTERGNRLRRSMHLMAAWLGFSIVAVIILLATSDAYYSPERVTYWAEASTHERRLIVGLLFVTGGAAGVLVVFGRRRTIDAGAAVGMMLAAWLVCVWMVLAALLLGLH